MLPLIAYDLLQSIELLAAAALRLADGAVAGFSVNDKRIREALDRNPILITALNNVIGYERGAVIAKQAYNEGRSVVDVASKATSLGEAELRRLLDPAALTHPGLRGRGGG